MTLRDRIIAAMNMEPCESVVRAVKSHRGLIGVEQSVGGCGLALTIPIDKQVDERKARIVREVTYFSERDVLSAAERDKLSALLAGSILLLAMRVGVIFQMSEAMKELARPADLLGGLAKDRRP